MVRRVVTVAQIAGERRRRRGFQECRFENAPNSGNKNRAVTRPTALQRNTGGINAETSSRGLCGISLPQHHPIPPAGQPIAYGGTPGDRTQVLFSKRIFQENKRTPMRTLRRLPMRISQYCRSFFPSRFSAWGCPPGKWPALLVLRGCVSPVV